MGRKCFALLLSVPVASNAARRSEELGLALIERAHRPIQRLHYQLSSLSFRVGHCGHLLHRRELAQVAGLADGDKPGCVMRAQN